MQRIFQRPLQSRTCKLIVAQMRCKHFLASVIGLDNIQGHDNHYGLS